MNVVTAYRGSVSHNLYLPEGDEHSTDDVDLIRIFLAKHDYYVGLGNCKTARDKFIGKYDIVSYEFKHAMRLLLKNNPNIFPILYLQKEHYISKGSYSNYWDLIVDNRDKFASKKMYNTFIGYSAGEYARFMKSISGEKAYLGYMGEKRKALVDKFGYDTRNASHLIRLLTMTKEFLIDGKLKVFRTDDRDFLLDIKRGRFSKEEVKEAAEQLIIECKAAYEKSHLPEEPDTVAINELVMDIIRDYVSY